MRSARHRAGEKKKSRRIFPNELKCKRCRAYFVDTRLRRVCQTLRKRALKTLFYVYSTALPTQQCSQNHVDKYNNVRRWMLRGGRMDFRHAFIIWIDTPSLEYNFRRIIFPCRGGGARITCTKNAFCATWGNWRNTTVSAESIIF